MADFMGLFFEIIVAVALFGPLVEYIDAANATGTTGLLLDLVPVFYVLVIVFIIYVQVKHTKK